MTVSHIPILLPIPALARNGVVWESTRTDLPRLLDQLPPVCEAAVAQADKFDADR
jgi:hypothetical protein